MQTTLTALAGCICCVWGLLQPVPVVVMPRPCLPSPPEAAAANYRPPAMPTTFPGP